jgi:putative transposase
LILPRVDGHSGKREAVQAVSHDEEEVTGLSARVQGRAGAPLRQVRHSDRGSPYASDAYCRALAAAGAFGSMSRRADWYDNAVAESYFAPLRGELVGHDRSPTRAAAETSIGDSIERFDNVQRRHSHLDELRPLELKGKAHVASLAA